MLIVDVILGCTRLIACARLLHETSVNHVEAIVTHASADAIGGQGWI